MKKRLLIFFLLPMFLSFKIGNPPKSIAGNYSGKNRYGYVHIEIKPNGTFEENSMGKISPCWTGYKIIGKWSQQSDSLFLFDTLGVKTRTLVFKKNKLHDCTVLYDGGPFVYADVVLKRRKRVN